MYTKSHWAFCLFALVPFASAQTQSVATVNPPPIDGHTRVHWLLTENLDLSSELDDIVVAGGQTLLNTPKEYGPHWEGFGERIGLIAANFALKSTMEVGLGSLWGEDPRYFRTHGLPLKSRLAHVVKMTFMAESRGGKQRPAYARYIAFPASSFISNEWTPRSQSDAGDAGIRVGLGFLSRMGENAWKEFIVRH